MYCAYICIYIYIHRGIDVVHYNEYIFPTSFYCSFRINRPNWLIYTVVGRSFYESPCIPGPSKKNT